MAVETKSNIDPTIQPFLSYGLTEAQRLYQAGGPQYYSGQTYVSPSETTQTGLQALEARARSGSPLTSAAQNAVIQATQGQQNPAMQIYSNLYGQSANNPTNQFYSGMMGGVQNPALAGYTGLQTGADAGQNVYNQYAYGTNVNPAMAGTSATASGQFLGGNPFFQGAFQPAATAARTQFEQTLGDVGSAASRAGRYGGGAMQTLQDRASGQFAKSLADTAGQLSYQNYAQERAMQEAAQGRLANLSQQDIANRMAAAQGLTQGSQAAFNQQIARLQGIGSLSQQDIANRVAAAQGLGQNFQQGIANQFSAASGLGSTFASDQARRLTAAGMAPEMAQADYADIQKLLAAGQAREGYTGAQQQADIARFNYEQTQPQQNLTNFLSGVYGNPLGRANTMTSFQQPSTLQNILGTAAMLGGIEKNTGWLSSGWGKLFGEG